MSAERPLAVVTGGCAGIGWSIGRRLAADGYAVVAADVQPGETAGTGSAAGIEWVELDVRDHEAVSRTFDALAERHGGIEVLVNNAGVQRHGGIEDLRWEEWAAVVEVNLHGVFACLQAAGRLMLTAGRGSIVNISSVAARGSAGRAPYATTKAAIVALTATAGAEWAARGVRVNAVAPGYVDTGVFREGVAAGTLDVESILARVPAARLARADEIADMVSFLVSNRATFVVGQTMVVDGGFSVDYGVPLVKRPGV